MQIDTNSEQIVSTFHRLGDLRESDGNFRIKVEGQTIMAHRDILIGASDYFKALLTSNMTEKEMGEVKLDELGAECVKICINFIYGMPISVAPEKIGSTLFASTRLDLLRLTETLETFMINLLDMGTFWEFMELADRYTLVNLTKKCLRFAERNIKDLKDCEEFYECLNLKFLSDLMKSNRTRILEMEKLVLLQKWAIYNPGLEVDFSKLIKFDQVPQKFQENGCFTTKFRYELQQSQQNHEVERKQICVVLENDVHLHYLNSQTNQLCDVQLPKRDTRCRYSIVNLNGYVYAISPSKALHRLRLCGDESTWEQLAEMKHEHGWWPPVTVLWGEIYVIGGGDVVYSNNIEKYDPDENKWEEMGNTPDKSQGCEIRSVDDGIYLVGGKIDDEYVKTMIKLSGDETSWIPLQSMTTSRAFAATTHAKGQIIVAGGINETGSLTTVESYNIETDQWTHLPDMNIARWAFQIYCINGTYLSVGGRNHQTASTSFENYVSNEASWEIHKVPAINTSTIILQNERLPLKAVSDNCKLPACDDNKVE